MTAKPTWTDEEIGYVVETLNRPREEVAEALGRSVAAISRKRTQLRQGWAPTRASWTPSEDDFLHSVPHFSSLECARHLNRSLSAIRQRRIAIGAIRPKAEQAEPASVANRTLLAKTCSKCGLLLDSSWFSRKPDRRWFSSCIRCCANPQRAKARAARWERMHARTGQSQKALQAISLPHATNTREPYVETDQAILADPSLTVIEKAIRLGRTYIATRHRLSLEGYSSRRDKGDPLEQRWIIDNPNYPSQQEEKAS